MKISILFLFCLLPCFPFAQTLSGLIEYQELGISFTIPTDWIGQEGEDYIILGSNSTPGMIILLPNESKDLNEMKREARGGVNEEGLVLQLLGKIKTSNDHRIEADYEGQLNFEKVKCFAIGMVNGKGSGLTILAITTVDQFGERQIKAAKALANSVRFYQPIVSKASEYWLNQIRGRRLAHLSTQSSSDYSGGSSGTSTRENFDLCSDGSFLYYFNSHSSFSAGNSNLGTLSGFGYANANDSNQGTWQVVSYQTGSFLELTFSNGNEAEYGLSENSEGHLLLNGTRYFRTDLEGCR
ncbi:MAG: hypothetical protein AAF985_13815 [Bacteroidota bacterium]